MISPFSLLKTNYDPVSLNYFARAGITSAREKLAVNNFVLSCKSNTDIWNSLQGGFVYLISPTSYGASLHNLVSSNFLASATTAPYYSTSGWTFNGVNNFIKTGFIPSTNMTINTGFMLVYSLTNSSGATFAIGALNSGGTSQWGCALRISTNNAVFNAYNSSSQTGPTTDSSGTFIFSLNSSTSKYIMQNSSILASGGTAAGTLPAFELYIGARNNAGAASGFAPYTIATAINGVSGLSQANSILLTDYVQTYNLEVAQGGR